MRTHTHRHTHSSFNGFVTYFRSLRRLAGSSAHSPGTAADLQVLTASGTMSVVHCGNHIPASDNHTSWILASVLGRLGWRVLCGQAAR